MPDIPSNKYNALKERYPAYVDAVETLGKALRTQSDLDPKLTHLIQLAAAAAIRSEGAVHSHARRALQVGASAEEIHQALISLTSTLGFPTVVAALTWVDDVLPGDA